ncbi:solute carrier family 25 member 45 [Plakobranchus ocellatus]|uniref:Solute carrier family 25 member 45 n=1 Tax=Plakobranchus ocellatus TaxID=259542 RepID=A0AAV4CPC6_9GAST|nr:solute carrier family 25 member 45 [Plakobranchus ocellatus]
MSNSSVINDYVAGCIGVPTTVTKKYYKGPVQAVTDIIKTSGLRGLYRGFCTQFVRDTPAASVYMTTYTLFQYESLKRQDIIPPQVTNFVGGGIAGVLSWAVIMPFDVIKSKIQTDSAALMYKGFWDCAWRLYASDGIKVFFLGFVPMAVRAFPVNAVTLMVYSEVLQHLNKNDSISS